MVADDLDQYILALYTSTYSAIHCHSTRDNTAESSTSPHRDDGKGLGNTQRFPLLLISSELILSERHTSAQSVRPFLCLGKLHTL